MTFFVKFCKPLYDSCYGFSSGHKALYRAKGIEAQHDEIMRQPDIAGQSHQDMGYGSFKDGAFLIKNNTCVTFLAVCFADFVPSRQMQQLHLLLLPLPRAALFPNVAKAFSGTKHELRGVLKSFLQRGGNLEAVEASVCASRPRSDETEGVRELLTVRQMREKGFSELL